MEKLTLEEISSWCEGRLTFQEGLERVSENLVNRVTTDSRDVQEGDLFVALKGERFNGHDFLDQIEGKKAAAALVEFQEMKHRRSRIPMILVEDSLKGFHSLARNYRGQFSIQTVAVAGSNGKTGTKEMTAAVLGSKYCVLKNQGNFNNHVGVPMSVMGLEKKHEAGVFEIGTNHPGELIPLLEIVRPFAGVVTTIGEEHLEFFRDLEGVAREEGTVAEYLPGEGMLILNADDPWSSSISSRTKSRISYFGLGAKAQYRAEKIVLNRQGTHFDLVTPQGRQKVELQLLGRHQVANALAAASVGECFGLRLEAIAEALSVVKPTKMRMETRTLGNGVFVIHDAYNANPSSMRAALETFGALECSGRKIAVLGEMRELGECSDAAHREMADEVLRNGVDLLVVVGKAARPLEEEYRKRVKDPSVEFFEDASSAGEFIKVNARTRDMVLLKASRGVALEKVLEDWE